MKSQELLGTSCIAALLFACVTNEVAPAPPAECAGPGMSCSISVACRTGAPGCQAITRDFATFTPMPGEELVGKCHSWTLNNAQEIWVNTIELQQDQFEGMVDGMPQFSGGCWMETFPPPP